MKNLARRFLNSEERNRVEAAVAAAEKQTSGEIVCLIASTSYHYPMANVIGSTAVALPLALILAPMIGAWLWIGTQNMWLFLGIFTVFFICSYLAFSHSSMLKRWFVSPREMEEEVQEAAVTNFFQRGLYQTRDRNGILLYISVFERKVWILADKGINAVVPKDHWNTLVTDLTKGIRHGRACESVCSTIDTIGETLMQQFPIKADDTNELQNVIIEGRDDPMET